MDEPPPTPSPRRLFPRAVVAGLILFLGVLGWRVTQSKLEVLRLRSEVAVNERMLALRDTEVMQLNEQLAAREAEYAERETALALRERTIAGREDAASERTQSSFQGLMIQQQLIRNLEALKASLPDMTPEIERLTREHAQLGAERERLERENAQLRQRAGSPPRPVGP